MKYLKNISKSLLYFIVPILILTLFITILNYFGIVSYKVINILNYIILFISILISRFKYKDNSKKKIIESIKYGLIISIILILFNLIIKTSFNIKSLITYIIIFAISIFGGIIKKK